MVFYIWIIWVIQGTWRINQLHFNCSSMMMACHHLFQYNVWQFQSIEFSSNRQWSCVYGDCPSIIQTFCFYNAFFHVSSDELFQISLFVGAFWKPADDVSICCLWQLEIYAFGVVLAPFGLVWSSFVFVFIWHNIHPLIYLG